MRATRVGTVKERFYARFTVEQSSGCWNWTGLTNAKGYGLIGGAINGKRYKAGSMLAHRVSWMLHFGDIPEGEGAHGTIVMHKCDNPSCVNPEHLRLGTQSENVTDMIVKGRRPPRRRVVGVSHWNSAIKTQADIDLICAQKGNTKALALQFGVGVDTIKRIRAKHGMGSETPEKFVPKPLAQEVIDHIRSTPPGTRGLTKLYGLSKTAISKIRKGITHK